MILCFAALSIGTILYLLFRPDTHFTALLSTNSLMVNLQQAVAPYLQNWVIFYLPDFLWGFSLACGLTAIYAHKRNGSAWCGLVAFLCGLIWEGLQHGNVVGGTGDGWDIVMYLAAWGMAVIINRKTKE